MPKKTATAKTVAKKAPVKKSTAKKSTAPAKSSASDDSTDYDKVGSFITEAIKSGELDFMLADIDVELTKRIDSHNKQAAAAAKKTSEGKSVSSAPKRGASASSKPAAKTAAKPAAKPLTLTAGKRYKVGERPAALAGGRVTFVEFKPDSDEKKVAVTVYDEKPGYPKGKKVVMPTSALVAAAR